MVSAGGEIRMLYLIAFLVVSQLVSFVCIYTLSKNDSTHLTVYRDGFDKTNKLVERLASDLEESYNFYDTMLSACYERIGAVYTAQQEMKRNSIPVSAPKEAPKRSRKKKQEEPANENATN